MRWEHYISPLLSRWHKGVRFVSLGERFFTDDGQLTDRFWLEYNLCLFWSQTSLNMQKDIMFLFDYR